MLYFCFVLFCFVYTSNDKALCFNFKKTITINYQKCLNLIFRQQHLPAPFPTYTFWRTWNSIIGGWQGGSMGSRAKDVYSISCHFISFFFFQYVFCQILRQAFVIHRWSEGKSCSHIARCLGWRVRGDRQINRALWNNVLSVLALEHAGSVLRRGKAS